MHESARLPWSGILFVAAVAATALLGHPSRPAAVDELDTQDVPPAVADAPFRFHEAFVRPGCQRVVRQAAIFAARTAGILGPSRGLDIQDAIALYFDARDRDCLDVVPDVAVAVPRWLASRASVNEAFEIDGPPLVSWEYVGHEVWFDSFVTNNLGDRLAACRSASPTGSLSTVDVHVDVADYTLCDGSRSTRVTAHGTDPDVAACVAIVIDGVHLDITDPFPQTINLRVIP